MWNRLARVTAPPALPVTLEQAKQHLRVPDANEDTLIESAMEAATAYFDGPQGIGRALVEQTWEMRLNAFPWGRIVIPLSPVRSVDEIAYTDTDGAEQTLPASEYIASLKREPATITPAFNQNWPSTRLVTDAVTINFTAGYEPGGGSPPDYAANVPADLKAAILWLTAHMYENRVPAQQQEMSPMPFAVENIIARYRVGVMG